MGKWTEPLQVGNTIFECLPLLKTVKRAKQVQGREMIVLSTVLVFFAENLLHVGACQSGVPSLKLTVVQSNSAMSFGCRCAPGIREEFEQGGVESRAILILSRYNFFKNVTKYMKCCCSFLPNNIWEGTQGKYQHFSVLKIQYRN